MLHSTELKVFCLYSSCLNLKERNKKNENRWLKEFTLDIISRQTLLF